MKRGSTGRHDAAVCWWRWGRVELPVQNPSPGPTTSVSDDFRQPVGRPSAGFRPAQSRVPRSGLAPDYVALIRVAPSLSDASTAHEGEAASTLTLPPKRRGREQAACWQLLRFAAGLTRPDGTSARVPWQPSPVETTHPHRTEPPFGEQMVAPGHGGANRPERSPERAPSSVSRLMRSHAWLGLTPGSVSRLMRR